MFALEETPYVLDDTANAELRTRLTAIEDRVLLLRRKGTLNEKTVRDYYGEKRFEQVAESNAIEGSTLTAGETELAVAKGMTITGHDPAFVRDAIALDRALSRIAELAKDHDAPTNIEQLSEVHSLLLGDRPGAGVFRKERVYIKGARHTPPKTWEQVMQQMTGWEKWSTSHAELPAPIRAAVLHAWLAHIHPFIDGNGRTARAITNLELIRAGYPPIIIKKKERERYIEALAESDDGGDIRSFLELILDRVDGALTGLEISAKNKQGFNPTAEKIRIRQEQQLRIWDASVRLLASMIEHYVSQRIESANGSCAIRIFDQPLDLDDYIEVCNNHSVSKSWAFTLRLEIPGITRTEKLAYIGHRSARMFHQLDKQGGPALYWSSKNPAGFPKWLADGPLSPFAVELTTQPGSGDEWIARLTDDSIIHISTARLASAIASALLNRALAD